MGLVNLDKLPELEIAEGIKLRAVTSETMTVAHVRLREGAVLPEHAHANEQVVNVIEGELELTMDGQAHRLTYGNVLVIPSNKPHSGRAIKDCLVVDVFHPARQDFAGSSFGGYPAD